MVIIIGVALGRTDMRFCIMFRWSILNGFLLAFSLGNVVLFAVLLLFYYERKEELR